MRRSRKPVWAFSPSGVRIPPSPSCRPAPGDPGQALRAIPSRPALGKCRESACGDLKKGALAGHRGMAGVHGVCGDTGGHAARTQPAGPPARAPRVPPLRRTPRLPILRSEGLPARRAGGESRPAAVRDQAQARFGLHLSADRGAAVPLPPLAAGSWRRARGDNHQRRAGRGGRARFAAAAAIARGTRAGPEAVCAAAVGH